MTEAYGDLVTGQYTVDTAQAEATAHIERYLAPSVSAVRMLQMAGAWPETPMDRVLFAPFGSADWPHFFTAGVGVNITVSLLSQRWGGAAAEIRYTLDGSSPSADSPQAKLAAGDRFPVIFLNRSGWLCASSWSNGVRTSANDSCALNIRYSNPRVCDFTAGTCTVDTPIASMRETYSLGPSIYRKAPSRNTSWVGGPIVLYGTQFATGIGLWAPQAVVYNLTGLAFRRLVLYVGVDQGKLGSGYTGPEPINESNGVLGWYMGWARAHLPLARLQVWLDGRLLEETPSLNVNMAPYPIDVALPPGATILRIIAIGAKGLRDASYALNYLNAVGGFLYSAAPVPPPPPAPPPAPAPVPAGATRVTAETCGAANWLQSWVINPSTGGRVMVGLLGSDLCLDATDATQLRAVKCSSSQHTQEWRWNASSAMLASAGNSDCPGGADYGCCVSELGSGSYKPGDVVNLYGCCDPQPPCTNQQIVLKPDSTAAGGDGHRLVIERAGLCISVQHHAPAPPAPPNSYDLHPRIASSHGPLRPASVPILPALNIGSPGVFLVGSADAAAWSGPLNYLPVRPDSTLKVNGEGRLSQTLGGWGRYWLSAGDLPVVSLVSRNGGGAYSAPCILPGLGAKAVARVGIATNGAFKWLDEFAAVNSTRSTTGWTWRAADKHVGGVVALRLLPLVQNQSMGFILRLDASDCKQKLAAVFAVGRVGSANDTIDLQTNEQPPVARITTGERGPSDPLDPSAYAMTYTELSAGPVGGAGTQSFTAPAAVLDGGAQAPLPVAAGPDRCAVFRTDVSSAGTADFLVLSGYLGHNASGVSEALQRLDKQSSMFVSQPWLESMKKQWFQHWIGGSLTPRDTFAQLRSPRGFASAVAAYDRYAAAASNRLQVVTDDVLFDVTIGNIAGKLAMLYEYPAFIHGSDDAKFGKVSYGQSPWSFAGYHREVASSLQFCMLISLFVVFAVRLASPNNQRVTFPDAGSQDVRTGRNRYWSIPFVISGWAEEQDWYMVQHCAWHYRWTGDLEYLRTIWPACRRALEHALTANDPDGDGYHTDYYMYNDGDTHERGGRSVGQQQLAIAALRFGAEMAAHLRNDTDQQRYERLANSTAQKMQHSLWHPQVGAFVDGEWNGEMRPHPEAMSEWPATTMLLATGDITPMQGYLASRYVAETLHVTSPSDPNVTIELISDFLPVKWSHH